MRTVFLTLIKNFEGLLKLYFSLTLASFLFDFVDFFIQLVRFGRKGDEYSDLVMIASSVLFILTDIIYVCWVYQV